MKSAPCTSVTFPREIHRMLEAITKGKEVAVTWMVRDAAEKYIATHSPLPREHVQKG